MTKNMMHDEYIMVGSSTTPTSDEKVRVKFPKDGLYVIEVNAWDNPSYGQATYDISILSLEKKGNIVAKAEEINENIYNIHAEYKLSDEEFNEGGTYIGAIFIGSQYNPLLIEVPGEISINPEVAVIYGEDVRVRENDVKVIPINVTTNKLIGALQLEITYNSSIINIDRIYVPDVIRNKVTVAYNITEGKSHSRSNDY